MTRFHLLLVAVLASAPAAWAQPKDVAKEASRAFKEGQQLFDNADYVGAIESFRTAYRLRPHFLVLCNIALCHERQNDMIKAAKFYERCLGEGAEKTDEADAVRNSLTRVNGRITWVSVTSKGKGGTVVVDGRRLGPAPARFAINPGSHVVEVRRKGAEAATETVTSRGGEQRVLELNPVDKPSDAPPTRRRRLHQTWFWSTAGLAAAFAITATVLGVQTLKIRDEYEEGPTQELLDRGRNRKLLTNIFWACAGAAAGSATVLFFYTDFRGAKERGPTGKGKELTLGVGLRGTF
jgi:tetratricopeptide (TPR) repeat protein